MKKWLLALCLFALPVQASEVVGSAGYYGIIEPTISGVATGDLDLNGVYKLILDADADTHIKSTTDDTFELTIGGTVRLTGTNSAITLTVPMLIPAGAVGAPGLAFSDDADGTGTGLYRSAANTIGFATNGVLRLDVNTADIVSTLPILGPNGTASAPSHAFTGTSSNTGMYLSATDTIGFSGDGALQLSISAGSGVLSTNQITGLVLAVSSGDADLIINANPTHDQSSIAVETAGGNQLLITTVTNRALDHGLVPQTNPTLCVQSAQDPTGAGANELFCLSHDQTNAVLDTYQGFVTVPDGVRGARVIGTTVAEPFTCAANEAAGISVYVDDTDDNISGLECICIGTGDNAGGTTDTWDWMRADDNATVCPFF